MKRKMVLFSTLFVSFAHANVSLHIEHPRNPSNAKDSYSVACKSRCNLEMKSHVQEKGTSASQVYRSKIQEILALKAKGDLPETKPGSRLVMYKIKATDGKSNVDLVLGYPLSYTGEEFTKYSNVISLIEEVKRNIEVELEKK